MGIHLPAVFKQIARTDVRLIESFSYSVERQYLEESAMLEKAAEYAYGKNASMVLEDISSDMSVLNSVRGLAGELAIVALYRVVELRTKKVLAWRYEETELQKISRSAPAISSRLARDGIHVDRLPHYDSIDELRRLNNAIKHEGTVTAELAKYPWWVAGTELGDLWPHFTRLGDIVPNFLQEFAEATIPPERKEGLPRDRWLK